ncbi:apomucin-like [Procambarus clarkii]|uniref:apomucin-like n=1 Tax=Procambarus clarkii TaxID=6728 RepID=UPI003743B5AD
MNILRARTHIEGTTTGAPAATGTPSDDSRESDRRGCFRKVTTRSRPAPASPPSLAAEATTPHRGKPSGGGTEGARETQPPSPAGTWTSTSTNRGANGAFGPTPSTSEDSQSLKSPTSAQANYERLERLGSGRISSELEADPETRAPLAGRTDARRSTAVASTTGRTGPHTAGGTAATPAPSTGGTRGEDAGPGSTAKDEEANGDASQRLPGRSTGAAGPETRSGGTSDGTATLGGGSATTGGTLGDAGGASAANGTLASSPPSSSSRGSGGKSSSRNKFTGATGSAVHPAA